MDDVYLNFYLGFLIFIFGLILGSFLNVIIVRLPQDKSVVRPGSHCPGCNQAVRWYDNVPVLSFLILKGKCRNCKAAISWRYPMVEFLTALSFLAAYLHSGLGLELLFRDLPFIWILIGVTFIDLEHRIIPDQLSIGGLMLGVLTGGFDTQLSYSEVLIGAAVGFSVFFFFAWAYERFSGKSGLGGGDIKLLAMMGAFLGWQGVFFVVFASSVLGSVIGIAWALSVGRKNILKAAIPYGPFLVLGALVYLFFGEVLWHHFMNPI
jgi:leader peptidase (prepilin peptidase) / N-methyltransferase